MIVDVHTHIWASPEQLGPDATKQFHRCHEAPRDRSNASPEAHDRAMQPVQYAIVHGFVCQRSRTAIGAEQVAAWIQRRPAKYLGFAGIDPMAPDYLDQLEQASDLGLVGVTISPAAQGFHPCHSRALALYERCQQMGFPIMVHPGIQFSRESILEFSQPHLFDEVALAYPELRLIIAQAGHPWIDPTLMLIGKHSHVWTDISDLVLRPWPLYNTLLAAHQQGVIDRLLVGSDFPVCTPQHAIKTIYSINTYTQGTNLPSVPREQLRSIVERDALTCLGLRRPAPDTQSRAGETADSEAEHRDHPAQKLDSAAPPSDTLKQGIG